MNNLKKLLIPITAILGAFWRAWFGGSWDCSRFWKYLALFCFEMAVLILCGHSYTDYNTYGIVVAFAVFWAVGHGDYFIVNDTSPDEARIKWIDWCLRKIYGEGNYYNFKGNVIGMFLRYTVYAIPVAILMESVLFVLAGTLVAIAYGACGKLFPDKWYTKISEFTAGALVFSLQYVCLLYGV